MAAREDPAVERYLYMLRTAPPETIERAHEEAFAKLSPEQRREALQKLAQALPPEEQRLLRDDPRSLARAATRTEIREPGMLQRLFGGGMGGGFGMGGMLAGSLLASLAGSFIGSAVADNFLHDHSMEGGEDLTASDHTQVEDAAGADDFGIADDFGGDFTDI